MAQEPASDIPNRARARTRNSFVLIFALIAVATGISFYHNVRQVREDRYLLATSTGKVLFRTVVATRKWNAGHGGVYVPIVETVKPNPYLTGPDRDLITTSGLHLTKVNPAYMTRIVGEILKEDGYFVHITSLKTLRPGNEADHWERAALEKFDKGSPQEHGLTGPPRNRIFRYMEPLKTEAACLDCHEQQGYKVGDIRGGISVAFPYAPFENSIRAEDRRAITVHTLFIGVAAAILLLLGRRALDLVESLQETRRTVRTLEGILPMCAHCKKIRKEGAASADPGSWVPVDSYIRDRSSASVSHGICPDCLKKHYGPGGDFNTG